MKKIIILLIIIVVNISYSQEKENLDNHFSNGQIIEVGEKLDDKRNGEWIKYYKNGTVEIICNYKAGLLTGDYKLFYKNGNTKQQGIYENEIHIGIWEHFRENGSLEFKANFGVGNVKFEIKNYNEKEELVLIFSEVDGEKSIGKYFYKNGQIKLIGNLISGVQVDEWKEYYECGQLKQIGNYIDGSEDGIWEIYHKNGKLKDIGKYVLGVPEGEWKEYYENGEPYRIKLWKNGELISESNN